MENFKELLDKLNGLKIIQHSMDWAENLPEDIYNEYFKGKHKEIGHGIDVDTHRHYETSITVINIFDEEKLLGIRHITNVFSESSMVEDCYVTMLFYEMKEVVVKSYEII